jgi:hypothetical protein
MSIKEQHTDAGVRLRILEELRKYPQIVLTPSQLRHETSEMLLVRLHICKQQTEQD